MIDNSCAASAAAGGAVSGWIDDGTAVRLLTAGDQVSIGQSTPFSPAGLSVLATSTSATAAIFRSGGGATANIFDVQRADGNSFLSVSATGSAILSQGLLHVGTTTGTSTIASNLQVAGTLQAGSGSIFIGNNFLNFNQSASTSLSSAVNAWNIDGDTLSIDALNNRVGIGTTSPYAKLSVAGLPDGTDGVVFQSTGRPLVNIAGGTNSYKTIRFSDPGNYRWDINVAPNNDTNASNLGFWSSTEGQVMAILQSGNVGIGTSSPSDLLTVAGITRNDRNYSGSAGSFLRFYRQGVYKANLGLDASDNFSILSTGDAPLVSVMNSGNVGIGTTSPYAKLSVQANNGETNSSLFAIASSTASATTTFLQVLNNGNVGLGIDTPSSPLNIAHDGPNDNAVRLNASSGASGSQFYIDFRKARTSVVNPAAVLADDLLGSLFFQGYNDAYRMAARIEANVETGVGATGEDMPGRLTFWTTPDGSATNVERLRIDSAGNVGIGTTSPQTKLEVVNTSSGATQDQLYLSNLDSATSTASRLTFRANDVINATSTAYITSILTQNFNTAKSDLAFSTMRSGTMTEAMRITDAGLVGIGSTSPAQELSVAGDLYITGGLGIGKATTVAGVIETTGVINVQGTGSSTFANGIKLTNGCFLMPNNSCAGSGSGGSVAGSDGQVQYNDGGAFGGASNLIYNDTSSRVGIGTSSPGMLLSVAGNTYFDSNLITYSSSTAANLTISYQRAATSTIPSASAYAWTIATSTTAVPILSFDTWGYKATSSFVGSLSIDTSRGLARSYSAQLDSTSILTIYGETDGTGMVGTTSVGIGTTSPKWLFHISGTNPANQYATTSRKSLLALTDSGTSNPQTWTMSNQGGVLYFATSSNSVSTSTTPALTVTVNGLFGIGTTSPGQQLSASGLLLVGGSGTSTFMNNLQVRGTFQAGTGSIYAGEGFLNFNTKTTSTIPSASA
ncbi:MAG: hypothetical protein UX07_C0046G0003 [Parcubacteria group bacterium GW2011_GWA2_45_30]|nr:MAG: hypothetical protein UX07_C0046G0003 [Parcubacteria group bacterium GW2011_GWA2_45_30]